MFVINCNIKIKFLFSLALVLLLPNRLYALEEIINSVDALSYGTVISRLGSCDMDPVSGVISSAGNVCVDSPTLGYYRMTGDPNEFQKIRLKQFLDLDKGIMFEPKGRLVNNLGADITVSSEVDTIGQIGSDGFLDIYVGGLLTLSKVQANSSTLRFYFEIVSETSP